MQTAKVSFRFVGNKVKPDYVTRVTGLDASSVKTRDMLIKKHPNRAYPTNSWTIDSTLSDDTSLAAHLKQLLTLIEPHADAIHRLVGEGYAPDFYCSLFYTSESGFIQLDPEVLMSVAKLNASLSIYTYKE